MGVQATWIVNTLRGAGLTVVTHAGWESRGHYGGFSGSGPTHVVWHHDASAKGRSPGVPRYMLDNWNSHGAQLWVDMDGVWHVLAAGPAYHAGRTRSGKPGNRNSWGIETDHTTGEAWPAKQLASLRVGTKAMLDRMGRTAATSLEFHSTICSPPGRKTDPDGLVLSDERRRVDSGQSEVKPYKLGERTLSMGDQGPDVADLQRLLGYNLEPDGDFGPSTNHAVVSFQKGSGLAADGIVGPNTLSALRKARGDKAVVTPDEPQKPEGDPILKIGDRGHLAPRVKDVQNALRVAGNLDLAVNGIFDTATDMLIRVFQKNRGIDQEGPNGEAAEYGIVGPRTWAALRVVVHG